MNETAAAGGSRITVIRAGEWQPHAATLKHVFLVGNLQRPSPHPFFRRADVEVILCEYQTGDHGMPHWHRETDEIEFVIEGRVGYHEIATDTTWCFGSGDLHSIPRGTCVRRIAREPARTLALKLPSRAERVHCRECARICRYRLEPYAI
jgi:hypothetical protein